MVGDVSQTLKQVEEDADFRGRGWTDIVAFKRVIKIKDGYHLLEV
jgi:hypothetical protein